MAVKVGEEEEEWEAEGEKASKMKNLALCLHPTLLVSMTLAISLLSAPLLCSQRHLFKLLTSQCYPRIQFSAF